MLPRFFRNLNLGVKLNAVIVLVFAILLVIVIVVTTRGVDDLIAQMGQLRVGQEAVLVQDRFFEAEEALSTNTKFLAKTPGLIEALANEDITTFRTLLAVGAAPLNFDDVELVNPEGDHLIRTDHQANPQEDRLIALALLGIEARGGIVVENETGMPEFRMVVALPLRDATSKILGVLIASHTVDETFLTNINFRRTERVSLGFIYEAQVLAQTQLDSGAGEFISFLEQTSAEYAQALNGQTAVVNRLLFSAAKVPQALAYTPIVLGGETRAVVGVIVQYRDLFAFQRQLARTITIVLSLAALVAIATIIWFSRTYITVPLEKLSSAARQMTGGDYSRRTEVTTGDEVGQLGRTFNEMAERLQQTMVDIKQRSLDLEQRSRYLEATALVGHAAASVLDADQLVQQVVEVIRQRFELYYVALFMVDERREWAVQRAGTGETGQARQARGHRLPVVASSSMIGWCIVNSQARIAQEAEKDEVRVVSPELPDTRSEVALPLRSRGRVIGALSLQSDRPNAFEEAVLAVLQIMADEVAVALDNAQLFAESQAALEQSRRAYGELSRQAWTQFLRTDQGVGYRYAGHTVAPATGEWQPEMVQALELGQRVVESHETEAVLAVPLKVRDQVIGVVNLRKTTPGQTWTDEESGLIETLTEQLGLALESARLYQDTQRRAAREQMSAQVTSRMRESLDVETVLKTAVNEMRQALGLEGVIVQLARPGTIETMEQ